MVEFEFHISPAPSSSRPQTGVGTCGTSSRSRWATCGSPLSRRGLSTASAMSGMAPSRQAADLVAEEPEAHQRACAYGTLGDDAALRSLAPRRRLLDHEAALRQVHLQGRVVEIAAIAALESCREPFEDLPVQANGMAAGAERKPVEVDAGR
jgi:hypothetical protein